MLFSPPRCDERPSAQGRWLPPFHIVLANLDVVGEVPAVGRVGRHGEAAHQAVVVAGNGTPGGSPLHKKQEQDPGKHVFKEN